jgi:hypothetical protein
MLFQVQDLDRVDSCWKDRIGWGQAFEGRSLHCSSELIEGVRKLQPGKAPLTKPRAWPAITRYEGSGAETQLIREDVTGWF